MTRFVLALALYSLSASAADVDIKSVLKGVETRYNRAKTLQVQFNQSYSGQGRPRQTESGQLVLRKPGRMRWDYAAPVGKFFISDGKQLYLYNPDVNRVEQMPLKASDDMRAPLAFLLGKLDFDKEFRDFQLKMDGANYFVTATAKSDRLPYEKVEMLVSPAYEIKRLVVNGLDRSVMTFQFDQEKLNPSVDDARFKLKLPPGATLVNGENAQ